VVAFVDLGTNSVRLLVVEITPNHHYTVLSRQKEMVRLGEREFQSHRLVPEAIDRTVLVCRRFAELARSMGAKEIVAVGTSASREAANRPLLTRRLREEAGIELRVISGREEARLIHVGVTSGLHLGDRKAVVVDIGGGSTEVIVGDQMHHTFLDSLPLGAVRLTTMFLDEVEGPVPRGKYEEILAHVRHHSARPMKEARRHRFDFGIGSSGTIENLAEIADRTFHDRKGAKALRLSRGDLRRVAEMLCGMDLDKRREVPAMTAGRADIIVAGAAILEEIMDALRLREIRVSDRGLRDGLLIDYLTKSTHSRSLVRLPVRERSVLQLARACRVDEPHSRTVARLALQLFDSATRGGLLEFGDRERELLFHAAMLHDVGSFINYDNHQVHTHYIIRNADLLGFDAKELDAIAGIALFHRKRAPSKKHPEFASLDRRGREVVEKLSVLLRLAEDLDRSHSGNVTRARLKEEGKGTLALEVDAVRDCELEVWGVRSHVKAVERAFRRALEVRVRKVSRGLDRFE
jgi:exopolyphosphatase/guanosine-5'-triphosphate,3'-diphosphate pyrophosphatase